MSKRLDYEELVEQLCNQPQTFYPGLLIALVEASYAKKVWQPGGASQAVRNAEHRLGIRQQSSAELQMRTVMELVPQTFGEATVLYPWLECEPHEWDNRSTVENLAYIIQELTLRSAN